MLRNLDTYFMEQDEPVKSCLLALRDYVLNYNENITEALSYGMPFYYYKGQCFSYLWTHKKHKQPYIGIVDGTRIDFPGLLQEKRSRMKIFLVDANKDLPIKTIDKILKEVLALYG